MLNTEGGNSNEPIVMDDVVRRRARKKKPKLPIMLVPPTRAKQGPVEAYKPKKIKHPPGMLRLKFAQLGPNMCKFELGALDVPSNKYRFCGLPTQEKAYCDFHNKITKVAPQSPHVRLRRITK